MPRKPLPKPTLTPLPHDWRERVPTWRIIAMLAQVPQSEYLDEVRRFEADMLAEGRLSDDWQAQWREHCRRRMMERFGPVGRRSEPPEVETLGWF